MGSKLQQQKRSIIAFGGGVDLVTPPQLVDPGKLLQCRNYECDLNGGYRQASGYERFDGQESPTDASYFSIVTTFTAGTFTLGETVTQAVSGATAILVHLGVRGLYVVAITGTFNNTDVITGGTSGATATATSEAFLNSILSDDEDVRDVRHSKVIYFRDLIGPVPGINDVRGAFRHEAISLAVRDVDGISAQMYRASATGWQAITASWVLFYDTKVATIPPDGTLLDDGLGNTATLHRASETTIGGTTGMMVLTGYTAGFAAGSAIEDGAVVIATVAVGGDAAAVTMLPGGKNEWESHSFSGAVDFYRVYTADGVNPAFEYDPIADVISPVYTDQLFKSIDTPTYISIYNNHLFLGYHRGIMRNSEPGDPFLWDAAAGSLEIHVGAEITGFDAAPKSLIVATKRTTYALTGQIAENFVLDVASAKTGARHYTMVHIGTTYMFDDRGVIELSRVQAFGNFSNATVTRLIQPALQLIRKDVRSATVNLTHNIYKIFTYEGLGVSITFQEGAIVGFGFYDLATTINFISNAEDETGEERIFFGGADGYVYQMDKGVSFDGAPKEAWFKTVYQNLKSPKDRKRFYRAFFDVQISGKADVSLFAEYAYGSPDVRPTRTFNNDLAGVVSTWDAGLWDQAVFDSSQITEGSYIDLKGTGDSISLVVYSNSAKDDIFTFKDVIYKYKLRRSMRGA